jgi:TonB-dependent SusC/RagA subfamily outer membrane receptor
MKTITRAAWVTCFLLVSCSHRQAESAAQPENRPPGTVLTAEDIRRSPGQSLEQLLLARVPGLTIERHADGSPKLILRGKNTLIGNDEPLVVVNGIPLNTEVSGNLSAINIHDIETVQVLRDATATAAFGVRGSNGVIVIRTKQS